MTLTFFDGAFPTFDGLAVRPALPSIAQGIIQRNLFDILRAYDIESVEGLYRTLKFFTEFVLQTQPNEV